MISSPCLRWAFFISCELFGVHFSLGRQRFFFFVGWGIGILPHTAVCYRLANARCPRALQPFTERLQFAIRQTALVRIPNKIQEKQKRNQSLWIDSFSFGWGIGIRTPTNRVRVCRATVTLFLNDKNYYNHFFWKVKNYFHKFEKIVFLWFLWVKSQLFSLYINQTFIVLL